MQRKILTIQHPYFLTWIGTFYKIYRADVFVFVDNSVLRSGDEFSLWNKNTISCNRRHKRMHIPILYDMDTEVRKANIDYSKKWVGKHLHMIEETYEGAPYFKEVFKFVREIYMKQYDTLVEFNVEFIKAVCEYLDIDFNYHMMSELSGTDCTRNDKVMELCKQFECDSFLIDSGAKNYIREDQFEREQVCVTFVDFKKHFDNYNVLDLLFAEGEQAFYKYLKDVELMTC